VTDHDEREPLDLDGIRAYLADLGERTIWGRRCRSCEAIEAHRTECPVSYALALADEVERLRAEVAA
jgi:hypothetical protein